MISIAIIFPLVFTIRGSFRRREKALEHLSDYRSALKTLHYFLMSNAGLPEENKQEFLRILSSIDEELMKHLSVNGSSTAALDESLDKVYDFITDENLVVTRGLREKIFRYMKDLHESTENLYAIHAHRTPISLKSYCKMFIYIFPMIYAPSIIHDIGLETPQIVAYFIVVLTEFVLISLYNIQNQLEYPFDSEGLDDIKLQNFRIDR
ncbi:MAG: hypothetical protein E4H26_02950 [Flavobacteriales bacterium]|nr:MAG: hypothetical protein E4H26_02950 [Flavobacteriales bacterium]